MKITDDILYRFFRNEHTAQEADAINEWLKEKPENTEKFQKACDTLILSEMLMATEAADELRKSNERKLTKRRWIYTITSAAVGIAASLVIGFFVSKQFVAGPAIDLIENSMAIQECLPGQHTSLTLPDGTVIHLNSGSRIEYPAIFHGSERRVKLNGEAMFDVTHDPLHPFVIETFAYNVKVLGTRFGVVADESSNEFSTTLLEGKVAICEADKELAVLHPEQRAVLTDDGLKTETLDDASLNLSWTKDIFSISGSSFEDIMKRAERCYGVGIVMDRSTAPEQGYAMLKVRISDGIEKLFRQLQKKSDFSYYYDNEDGKYHIQ